MTPVADIDREIPEKPAVPFHGVVDRLRVSPSRQRVWIKSLALPLVRGVYELVRICFSLRALQALAKLREM